MDKATSSTSVSTGLSPINFYGTKDASVKKTVMYKNQLNYKTRFVKKKRDGRINKNVSHRIRKPKNSKIKKSKFSTRVVSTLRVKPLRMPSRLATNRSALKENKKVKFHKLSSPGVSFLDHEAKPPSPLKKKFFTTRSEEAAVVRISSNIKLSSINGKILMNSRQTILPKKNIGRRVEKELDNQISSGSLNNPITENMEHDSVINKANNHISQDESSSKKEFTDKSVLTPISNKLSTITLNCNSPKSTDILKAKRVSPRKLVQSSKTPLKENMHIPSPKRRISPRKLTYGGIASISPRKFSANNYDIVHTNSSVKNPIDSWTDDSSEYIGFNDTNSEDAILTELLADNDIPSNITNRSPTVVRSRRSPRKDIKNVKYFPVFQPRMKKFANKLKKERRQYVKRSLTTSDPKQMTIDAGQSVYGAIHCKSCNFLYEAGDANEEKLHNQFHFGHVKSLAFNGWKNERLVSNVDKYGGRILKIIGKDSSIWWRKVSEVIEIVDMELGFIESGNLVKERSSAFLYVKNKTIVGCLIVEDIDKAYKFIQQVTGLNEGSLLCCSSVPQKAFVGVSRIWVRDSERRSGIASALMNAMRSNMYPCHYVKTEEFAFSDPTEEGMIFAKNYTGIFDFLVYRKSDFLLTSNIS